MRRYLILVPEGEKPYLIPVSEGESYLILVPEGERPYLILVSEGEKPYLIPVSEGESYLILVPEGGRPYLILVPEGGEEQADHARTPTHSSQHVQRATRKTQPHRDRSILKKNTHTHQSII